MHDTTPMTRTTHLPKEIRTALGNPTAWTLIATYPDGSAEVLSQEGQDPCLTAQQLADALHAVSCPGCERCGSTH